MKAKQRGEATWCSLRGVGVAVDSSVVMVAAAPPARTGGSRAPPSSQRSAALPLPPFFPLPSFSLSRWRRLGESPGWMGVVGAQHPLYRHAEAVRGHDWLQPSILSVRTRGWCGGHQSVMRLGLVCELVEVQGQGEVFHLSKSFGRGHRHARIASEAGGSGAALG